MILLTGTRSKDMEVLYPVSELAARYGASVEEETTDPDEAYAPLPLGRWGAAVVLGPAPLGLTEPRRPTGGFPASQPHPRISESCATNSAGMSAPGAWIASIRRAILGVMTRR